LAAGRRDDAIDAWREALDRYERLSGIGRVDRSLGPVFGNEP
jgi:hypothetical protein